MGLIYDNFKDRVLRLWNEANRLEKPIHSNITWTYGLIHGKADFLDLQVQGLALAASIIITEPLVPKIICSWDSPRDPTSTRKDNAARISDYPQYLLRAMPSWEEKCLRRDNYYGSFKFTSKYFDLHRSPFSVSAYPNSLAMGYRSKYLGMNYVTTPYGIISDIDTISLENCIPYLELKIRESPDIFVWTNHQTDTNLSVGLCLYHMEKYRNIFLPRLYNIYWSTHRQDSRFVPEVITAFPETKNILTVGLFDGEILNSEKFYRNIHRGNNFKEGKTTHYHSWKREYQGRNATEFIPFYKNILDMLEKKL